MRLIDGAQSIAGDLPRASCTTIDVASEAGDAQDTGVRRHSAIARTRDRLREALAQSDGPVMLIGGDCGAAVGAIEHAASQHPDLVLVWFDAHADLHTPETSSSGAFGGMALRAALGDGTESLRLNEHPLSPTQVVMAGVREYDDSERAFVNSVPVTVIETSHLAEPEALAEAVSALGATKVYVHIDLDVLDPSAISGVTAPVPFGVQVVDVVASISQLRSRVQLVGSSICGFAPASPAAAVDDLGSILRLVGSLA